MSSADARSDAPSPKSFLSQQSFFPPAHPILSKENAQLVVMGAAGAHLGIGDRGGENWNPEEPDSHPCRRPRPSPPESDDSNIFQHKRLRVEDSEGDPEFEETPPPPYAEDMASVTGESNHDVQQYFSDPTQFDDESWWENHLQNFRVVWETVQDLRSPP